MSVERVGRQPELIDRVEADDTAEGGPTFSASPWLDSDIEALEESIRLHPARGFMLPRYTVHCPSCGRGVPKGTLESPHYAPESKPLCASCRSNWAKWYRSPEQRAASARAKEKRRELGIKPNPGGFPVE